MPQTRIVIRSGETEVPHRVLNHAGRGDNRGAPTRAQLAFDRENDKKSTEELRAAAEKQAKDERWKEIGPEVADRISAVLHRYPQYKDTVRNGQLIAAKLSTPEAIQERRRQHRADNDYSLLEIAGAIEEAMAQGADINEAAVRKQRIADYSDQLASVSRTEDRLYEIPLHELRALASGHHDPLGPRE